MLILCGIPLLFMELSVGQYTSQGPVGAMQKLTPFFQGEPKDGGISLKLGWVGGGGGVFWFLLL